MIPDLSLPAVVAGMMSQRSALSGATMGTRFSVVFQSQLPVDLVSLQEELQAAVDRVDAQMSPWKPGSDLNRFNRTPAGEWVDLPEDMFAVVHAALKTSIGSDGAFDPFVGELVCAWGFGPVACDDGAEVVRLRESWGSLARQVELDREGKRLRRLSDCKLDLCGIAKGYGVDCLSRVMHRWGLSDHLVSIDGEVRASGCKPGGDAWCVGLEKPVEGVRDSAFAIELADTAIATSGSYRQMRIIAGQTVSHTMHPQQGQPVCNGVLSVSVLADTCMEADAWATALMVLGWEKGLACARKTGLDAIFVIRNERGEIELKATDPGLLPEPDA
ncbi:FAD:protein FMN transferase [Roseibium sediminicola]|uniref:FAD:protein FMN transferase n=1 Tax=Roseibium sediminicola TaxID=2933272 RepID=A0ABT0GZ18_9HYPH|nr:FAD:protein FMN transferase [Roseibium sp. CAU 1639]MCK7614671.1 FAD:protein FMN transferase [Roseibium sp. CAU 1639]